MRNGDTKRQNLTARAIDDLQPAPDGKPYRVYDQNPKQLAVSVSPSGHKSLGIYRSWEGKPFSFKIADWRGQPLEEIRKKAKQILNDMDNGNNPKQKKAVARAELTLAEAFGYWLEDGKTRGKRSWQVDEYRFAKYLGDLHRWKLTAIGTGDLMRVYSPLVKRGKLVMVNRLNILINCVYKFAARYHDYKGPMPGRNIDRYPEYPKERHLTTQERPLFLAALNEEDETTRDLFTLLLLTGCRISNLLSSRFENFDFLAKKWTIDANNSKTKRTIILPLSDKAMEILERRRGKLGKGFVFPSDKSSMGRMNFPDRALKRITKRAGIKGLSAHCLRHAFAVECLKNKVGMFQTSKLMGHKSMRTTAERYAAVEDAAQEEAINKINEAMLG